MNKFINVKAYIVCLVVSCLAYTWQYSSIYYVKHAVYPKEIIDLMILVFGFGFVFSLLIGLPLLYALKRFNLESYLYYLFSGGFAVGVSVVVSNGFSLKHFLQHPEGFIIGALTGLLYWAIAVSR